MKKRFLCLICIILASCFIFTSISYAVSKDTFGTKVKNFWRRLFNYPARVTEESAAVVADTGKRGTVVVTTEIKRIGEVTSGDIAKTKELVTEPIVGTVETAVRAVEGTVNIPVEALKEEPAATEKK